MHSNFPLTFPDPICYDVDIYFTNLYISKFIENPATNNIGISVRFFIFDLGHKKQLPQWPLLLVSLPVATIYTSDTKRPLALGRCKIKTQTARNEVA